MVVNPATPVLSFIAVVVAVVTPLVAAAAAAGSEGSTAIATTSTSARSGRGCGYGRGGREAAEEDGATVGVPVGRVECKILFEVEGWVFRVCCPLRKSLHDDDDGDDDDDVVSAAAAADVDGDSEKYVACCS